MPNVLLDADGGYHEEIHMGPLKLGDIDKGITVEDELFGDVAKIQRAISEELGNSDYDGLLRNVWKSMQSGSWIKQLHNIEDLQTLSEGHQLEVDEEGRYSEETPLGEKELFRLLYRGLGSFMYTHIPEGRVVGTIPYSQSEFKQHYTGVDTESTFEDAIRAIKQRLQFSGPGSGSS